MKKSLTRKNMSVKLVECGYVEKNGKDSRFPHHCQAGRRAVPIDLEIGGATMDLTTDSGFANALYHAANLREGAACMAAPVCGSFVFMKLIHITSNLFCLCFMGSS